MPVKVSVNGYGTIGKRVADAVARQPDMTLIGVAKTRPNYEAALAQAKGIPLYVAGAGSAAPFEAVGLKTAGTVADMIRASDLVVDCAPEKVGRENAKLYEAGGRPAIFQGGEKADVAEVSFNALANFPAALGKRRVRVVSCNTTGLSRAVAVLRPAFGIAHWEATMVRRAADPAETERGPINGILPSFKIPSHHGPDVRTIFPDLSIATAALVVPTTLMHIHVNHVRLERPPGSIQAVLERFRATPRFHVFHEWEGIDGTPQVMEYARDRSPGGRPDMMENVLWEHGMRLEGPDLYFFQAIHQESIVVPENVDAIRAMTGLAKDAAASIELTDRSLGIPRPAG
ncbi:MAG TPA: type II glyceraldehyde-3-phosphate dehydrogenase [Thermoplasmata archaeon]|nr:type II glyceraldehyde-3-phosphate dehydrogenase [Thermoplasmata archaeon]